MRTIYLDYNATTPLDPAVREALLTVLDGCTGNPSSIHRLGRRARAYLDDARDRVASICDCRPTEIVFTSGGTESNNLAILGAARHRREQGRHLITSAVEHHAVLNPCRYLAARDGFELTVLPVDAQGRVRVEDLEQALRPDTVLVSVQAANNEVGTLQPVAALGALCRRYGVAFHTDAVQWFGKEPLSGLLECGADLISLSAHKFHGPMGAGALLVRAPFPIDAILHGGGQENERRGGTENLAAMVGLAEAAARFLREPVFERASLAPLAQHLRAKLRNIPDLRIFTPTEETLSNTVGLTVGGADSLSLLAGLDLEGVCASSASACSVGSLTPSHVLQALGASVEEASSMVRFSLGRETSRTEIETAADALARVCARVRTANSMRRTR